ncbi:hypothetical protein [Acetobacteroides hydrogenigenes]|uniref:Lipoprotein n=1 Tax=Acetobacteroides hydrogenigenes TaxID=979970 RepID=A0A4R2EXI4_9BACT|nr:hypothetical protein [Acetobacteroides hydrogenigenes]TCN72292.1 hypothetical protein CLV25_102258 [Acetobacteroides hydrogenigenes]
MKSTFLKMTLTVMLFALMGAGCEKEEEYEDIPLQYTKCPCDHNTAFIKNVARENILLFDLSKTSLDAIKSQTYDGEKSEFVLYDKTNKSMTWMIDRNSMKGFCYICNVPDKINDLVIPSKGIAISFTGDEFELCTPSGGITNNFYSSCVLKTLKRKLK